jgi:hypothetical protein
MRRGLSLFLAAKNGCLFVLVVAAAVMLLFHETQKSYQANHEKVYFYNLLYKIPPHSLFHLSIYVP